MPKSRTDSKYLSAGGSRLVRQLFLEFQGDGPVANAVYTFSREDKQGYPSLYLLYMKEKDITEARFVSKYLFDWQQWEQVSNSYFLKEEIGRWRTDLKALVLGELVDTLIEDAHSGSKSSKSSAKYLVDKLSKGKPGKPTTAVIATTEETSKSISSAVADDAKRLGLVN